MKWMFMKSWSCMCQSFYVKVHVHALIISCDYLWFAYIYMCVFIVCWLFTYWDFLKSHHCIFHYHFPPEIVEVMTGLDDEIKEDDTSSEENSAENGD